MWLANLVCVGMIQVWSNAGVMTLGKIWWALAVSMIISLRHILYCQAHVSIATYKSDFRNTTLSRHSWARRLSRASFDSNLRLVFGKYCKRKMPSNEVAMRYSCWYQHVHTYQL